MAVTIILIENTRTKIVRSLTAFNFFTSIMSLNFDTFLQTHFYHFLPYSLSGCQCIFIEFWCLETPISFSRGFKSSSLLACHFLATPVQFFFVGKDKTCGTKNLNSYLCLSMFSFFFVCLNSHLIRTYLTR